MLTPRENFLNFLNNKPCEWTPTSADILTFRPAFYPDHLARGMVAQQEPFTGGFGGLDILGCEWEFEELVGGSMETGVLMDSIEQWEDVVKWPDLDSWDWEGFREANREYLNTDKLIQTTIYTGYFERLIAFVGFEKAAVALIDEDQQPYVEKLFDKLTDLYIDVIDRFHRYFNVELVEIHDDWGNQRSLMFSVDTHEEMIAPYIKRLVEAAHAMGVYMEQHSCGKIEKLIPNLIATGMDTWRGQAINDKKMLVDNYGDVFKFGVEVRPKEAVDDATAMELVKGAYDTWHGKNVWIAIGLPFTPQQKSMMGQYVREHGLV